MDFTAIEDSIIINETTRNSDAYRISCCNSETPGKLIGMEYVRDNDYSFCYPIIDTTKKTDEVCLSDTAFPLQLLNWCERVMNSSIYKNKINERWA